MIPEDLLARRFGEVVESSTTSFVAQCYRIDDAPSLGALVRTNEPHIYAVVSQITTEPLDTTRPVLARGEYAASEDELLRGSPQLSPAAHLQNRGGDRSPRGHPGRTATSAPGPANGAFIRLFLAVPRRQRRSSRPQGSFTCSPGCQPPTPMRW